MLGAFDPISLSVVCVTNTSDIDSSSVCDLLWEIGLLHPGRTIKIVLDNAACQRCFLVQEFARELGIALVFLPSCSPNLNLIERYWKFVKKKCPYNRFYESFDSFCAAIDECVRHGGKHDAAELKSLTTLKFQSFEYVQCLAV